LNSKGIETRQIMAGDMSLQPVVEIFDNTIIGDLKNVKLIHKNAFFFGNHQNIGEKERNHLINCFEEFFSKI